MKRVSHIRRRCQDVSSGNSGQMPFYSVGIYTGITGEVRIYADKRREYKLEDLYILLIKLLPEYADKMR